MELFGWAFHGLEDFKICGFVLMVLYFFLEYYWILYLYFIWLLATFGLLVGKRWDINVTNKKYSMIYGILKVIKMYKNI